MPHSNKLMKKLSFAFCSILSIYAAMNSSSAFADEIVYFECNPGRMLYFKVFSLGEIAPVLNKRTFDLEALPRDQRKQECELSKAYKAVVEMYAAEGNENPKNNNVSILLNNKLLNNITFENPDLSYSYYITKTTNGKIDIVFTEFHEEAKSITTHLDQNTK